MSYEKIPVHLLNNGGEQKSPEYLSLNPQGLVPTLDEHGHILSQSLAIIEYLEEISPTPSLFPPTPLAKAKVRSMALLVAADIHPLNNLRVLNRLRHQFDANDEAISSWYHHWLKEGFDALEKELERIPHKADFCYGNQASLADICLIPQVYNAKRFNFSMDNYPLINQINEHCLTLKPFIDAIPNEE